MNRPESKVRVTEDLAETDGVREIFFNSRSANPLKHRQVVIQKL
jgi:hypothetical protein